MDLDAFGKSGMSEIEVERKAGLLERCVGFLEEGRSGVRAHGRSGARASAVQALFVPGRIEVLGKHTDYAGGRSLLCAVERGFVVVFEPREDDIIHVSDAVRDRSCEFALEPNLPLAQGDWSNYVGTVIRRVARNFPNARRGADIAFASDLPAASGMSSSSALMIAIFLAIAQVNELQSDPLYRSAIVSCEALAAYLATVENGQSFGLLSGDRGVGTFGGSEDHTAILCCQPGFISQYAFSPVRAEREIPLPNHLTFVVANSGIVAQKTGSAQAAYNQVSLAAQRILGIWNEATYRADESLAAALASAPDAHDRLRGWLQDEHRDFPVQTLLDRLEQFALESNELVPAAADALAASNITAFGELVDRSQRAAETKLGNQIPETIGLAQIARREGALAATAFGAGFGGSVWALISQQEAKQFMQTWQDGYHDEFPAAPKGAFFLTRPGPHAVAL
jgi:galactokinase